MAIPLKMEDAIKELVAGMATEFALQAHRQEAEGVHARNRFTAFAETVHSLFGGKEPKDAMRRTNYITAAEGAAGMTAKTMKRIVLPALTAAKGYTACASERAIEYTAAAYDASMAAAIIALETAAFSLATLKDLKGRAAMKRFKLSPDTEKAPAATR